MVYNKRNSNYDIIDNYEAGCVCVPKRTRTQRSRQQGSNEDMYPSKCEDSCLSADIINTRKNYSKFNESNRFNRKISGFQKRSINRSVQNLCSFSFADATLRCETPIMKVNKKAFE